MTDWNRRRCKLRKILFGLLIIKNLELNFILYLPLFMQNTYSNVIINECIHHHGNRLYLIRNKNGILLPIFRCLKWQKGFNTHFQMSKDSPQNI